MAQNVVVPPFDVAPETVVGATPQGVFPFDFPFWEADDILVSVDGDPLLPSAFTVIGYSVQNGEPVEGGYGSGQVTLNTAVSNCTVTIDRFVKGERKSQFSRAAPLGMPPLNADLNKLTARQQDLRRATARSILMPVGEEGLTLPSAGVRADRFLSFDAAGNLIARIKPDDFEALNKINLNGDNLAPEDKEHLIAALEVSRGGFWTDVGPGAVIWRASDRVLFGDAVQYTGGRNGTGPGLGTDWLTARGANYFAKNAQVMGLSTNRIAALFGSWTPPGVGALINMGLGAVSLNEGVGSTGRALYAEAFHKSDAGATVGLEVQGGNFTAVMPSPNAYGIGPGYHGIQVAVEAAHLYTTGNGNTPVAPPTMPGGAGLIVSGGSVGATYQKWKVGLVFPNGGLFRGVDGLTGTAKAISMAVGHELVWEVSSSQRGATIRSDVTGGTVASTGLIFSDSTASMIGAGEAVSFRARHTTNGVNYLETRNSTAGNAPLLNFIGADPNVNGFIQTNGTGLLSFRTQGGASEAFRVSGPATAVATNYISTTAVGAGGNPNFTAAGTDANVGIDFRAKGAGSNRIIAGDGTVKFAANNTGISFFAAPTAARQSIGAAATDAASTQALANNIRAALNLYGLTVT